MHYNYLILVDVDGTLVNEKKELTLNTITAIKNIISKGSLVTIASGRPLSGLKEYLYCFPFDIPVITYNGGKILTSNSKKIIYELTMNDNNTRVIFDYVIKNNLKIIVWSNDVLYVNDMNDDIKYYESTSGVKGILYSNQEIKKITNITKMIIYDNKDTLQIIKNEIEKLNLHISLEFSSDKYLELFNKDVSKGKALNILSEYLGFPKDKTIAIGDNYNDLSMLNNAHISVAMGNAPTEIKKITTYVTKTNEEDGVAYFLDNIRSIITKK